MKKFERLEKIRAMTREHKYVLITEMIRELHTSESTVRRDIEELEKEGCLFRSQGSIIWNDKNKQYLENIYYRQIQNSDIKQKIAEKAVSIIQPNETLFFDTGTTMLSLAKTLDENLPLTVVTNDLEIALALENKYNVSTVMLGGFVKRGTHTIIGTMGNSMLEGIYFEKVFFSPAGITEEGFSFLNLQAMDIRKKVTSNADKIIMVADSSKFGKRSSVLGFTFNQCDILYTDRCDNQWKEKIEPYMDIITG
jgi:DeoR/GlpR family transcriptional regulator of sugar metabolism